MILDFKTLLNTEPYSFLRNCAELNDNIILLTLGGSYAYGTNIETSDVDIRGIATESRNALLGLPSKNINGSFESFVNEKTDTVIYSLRKIISLLLDCNPNTIEMLGCKPEHYIYVNKYGKMLLDNAHLFLSQRAIHSFGGYANAQLRRLTNALSRDAYTQAEKEKHILDTLPNAIHAFNNSHPKIPSDALDLYLGDSTKDGYEQEILMRVHLEDYPLRDWQALLGDLNSVVRSFEKLNKRNHKKDERHLNKHAMHLIRLYQMGIDILENGMIKTYRDGADHELLMSIRNGEYMKTDGTYRAEFFELLDAYAQRLDNAKANTCLPEQPDYVAVNEMLISINDDIIHNK